MSEWKEYKLNDLVTKSGDGLHGTPNYDPNGEYYFINGSNLINGKISVNENTKRVTNKEFNKYKKELTDRTILVSINGTLGNIATYNNEKVILGKSACYFNVKEDVCKEFIKYIATDNSFQHYISEYATGSTIKNVPLKAIRDYTFKLPDLPTQTVIAEILSSLDDKIELNNKINQELETLAQTLFKQWFIDFEFPNENGEPYKSSGGEMVDSALGEIPKEWKVENLCEELKIVYGKNLPTTKLEVSGYDVFGGNGIIGKYHSYLYEDPQVLIACRGAASGKINISNRKSFVTNNSLVLDFTNSASIQFTYLKYWSLFQDFTKCVSGSAQPQITIENLKSYLILVPNENLVEIFSHTLSSTLEKINELNFESNQLEQLRDTLLPKLISGELEINEISK